MDELNASGMKFCRHLFGWVALIFSLYQNTTLHAQCTELLWADEFTGSQLDTTKWNKEVNGDGGGNSELQYYTDREENIQVNEGTLKITALKENYLFHEYTSARINTKYKGDWRFGRVEARLKLPEGKGLWPAFWMLPTENKYGNWPNSGEIDIMEMVGGGSGDSTIYGTLHVGPPYGYTNGFFKLNEKFSEKFHLFSLAWTPDSMVWYVDDLKFSKKTEDDVSQWQPFQEQFFMILNLAVGGNWPGSPNETTQFPQTLEADYVRVYGNPMEQDITTIDSAYPLSVAHYSFMDVPGATFHWLVDAPDAEILDGIDSPNVTIQWGCQSGTVTLEVIYPNCGLITYQLPVTFSKPEITGVTEVLPYQSDLLFTVPFLNNTHYNWILPQGSEIIGNPDTNSITVRWGCVPGEIGVSINNSCEFITVSSTISFTNPVVSGSTTVPAFSEQVRYSVTDIPGALYNWFVPEGAIVTDGQNTSQILVNFADKGGTLKVVYENFCGKDSISIPIQITDTLLLCDYETTTLSFKGWDDGVNPVIVENPYPLGINLSAHVGKSFKAQSQWSGLYSDLGYNLNLKMHNRFSLLIYGPKAGKFLFKLEDVGEGIAPELEDVTQSPSVETAVSYSQPNVWQKLEFDFSGINQNFYDRITLFYDFGSTDTNTFYFDDIRLLPADTIYFTQANLMTIEEGSEDGKQIMILLKYDSFVESLNPLNWSFSNLPEGVSVGNILRKNIDTVILTLHGNRTIDYDTHILNFTTTINKSELIRSQVDLTTSTGVKFKAIIEDGILLNEQNHVQVFPNPAKNYCQIVAVEPFESIILYQLSGYKIMEYNQLNTKDWMINTEELAKGMYLMEIKTVSQKRMIERMVIH